MNYGTYFFIKHINNIIEPIYVYAYIDTHTEKEKERE